MNNKYNWKIIQKYYNTGKSIRQCMKKFGFASRSWGNASERGDIKSRTRVIPIEKYLVKYCHDDCHGDRGNIKRRLIHEGILKNKCYQCGQLPTWNNKELVMVLDHINGKKYDYRLTNLRLLCPNCNAQTETFSGKNVKRN